MGIFHSDGLIGLPRFDPCVYPPLDLLYEVVVGYLMFQFTLLDTQARMCWVCIVLGHGLLIPFVNYGGEKNVFGFKTSISIIPLWVMSFYDIVVFSWLFFVSAYGYLDGMCEFAGFSGEQWAFFLLCNEPLNVLAIPNVTYPWQNKSAKKKTG